MEENKTHYVRIAQACYPAADWPDVVLMAGEVGWESDTGKFKVGNGSSTWSELEYWQQTEISEKLIATQEWVTAQLPTNHVTQEYFDTTLTNTLSEYATQEYVQSQIPNNISDLNNDSGYVTQEVVNTTLTSTLNEYATQEYVQNQIPTDHVTKNDLTNALSGYATQDQIPDNVSDLNNDSGYITKNAFATEDFKGIITDIVEEMDLQVDNTLKVHYGFGEKCKIDTDAIYVLILDMRETHRPILLILQKDIDGEYLYSRRGESWQTLADYYKVEDGYFKTTDQIGSNGPNYGWPYMVSIPLQSVEFCLREDTLIPLEDGTYKMINEIVAGDRVGFYNTFNHDPSLRYNDICVPSTTSSPKVYRKFIFF